MYYVSQLCNYTFGGVYLNEIAVEHKQELYEKSKHFSFYDIKQQTIIISVLPTRG